MQICNNINKLIIIIIIIIVLSDKPQPSHEYPVVLFSGVGYDSLSDNGYYKRLKENEFIVWGRTIADQQREFRYRSMIIMPGRKLSFKGNLELMMHSVGVHEMISIEMEFK